VHGTANCKGDSPTVAASRATPVILVQILKRLTADGTEFCGGVVVLAAGENVGDLVIGGRELLRLSSRLEPLDTRLRVPEVVAMDQDEIVCLLHFRVKGIQQSIAVIGPIRSCARLRIRLSV
jgi:hypothetical protein